MKLRRCPNGNLLIPVGEYADGIYMDWHEEITPDDPRYPEWAAFLGTEWEETLPADSNVTEAEREHARH